MTVNCGSEQIEVGRGPLCVVTVGLAMCVCGSTPEC